MEATPLAKGCRRPPLYSFKRRCGVFTNNLPFINKSPVTAAMASGGASFEKSKQLHFKNKLLTNFMLPSYILCLCSFLLAQKRTKKRQKIQCFSAQG
jgi:hypothetical protein